VVAQEERFIRKKYGFPFPTHAIQYCLNEAKIAVKDLNFVGYYEKPFIKFERLLFICSIYAFMGLVSFLKAMSV